MLFNQGLSLYTNTGFDNGQIFAIYAHQFEIPVLRNMLNSVEHDEYDAAGNLNLATYENYAYDNTNGHYQLIKKTTGDSKADTLNTYYKYPQDYGNLLPMSNLDIAAQGIQELQKTHVLQPVEIYSEKITTTATPLKTYLNGTVNIFYNNIPVVNQLFALQIAQPLLSFIPSSVSSNTFNKNAQYTSRVNFSKYDVSGRLLEQQLTNGPFYAYQWGYKGQYPVAQASNTKVNDIFYDSFEEGDGTLLDPKTGHYSFNGSYSKTLTGLDAGTYTLSYWKKTGSTWVWTINTNIPVTGSSYPLSISGQIDDIRFYPSGAQMITYTYDPLIGVTSATDTKGEITYYEYDGFQRLLNIKDKDGNIIKHTDYHYQGQ